MKRTELTLPFRIALSVVILGLLPTATSGQESADETVNPEVTPVEDKAPRQASPDAEPVEDSDELANEESEPLEETAGDTAKPDSEPVEDETPRRATPDAEPVQDNPDSEPVEDDTPRRASPDAEPVEDTDELANDESESLKKPPVGDRRREMPEDEKATGPVSEEAGARGRPQREGRQRQDDDGSKTEEARADEDAPGDDGTPVETNDPEVMRVSRQADDDVRQTTSEVQQDLDQKKLEIADGDDARNVIEQVLGTESRISQAESRRDETRTPRRDGRDDRGLQRETGPEFEPEARREAVRYFRDRFEGGEITGPPPAYLNRGDRRAGRDDRDLWRGERSGIDRASQDRWELREERAGPPRYFHEGRRYVHYDSRESIPAVLLAAERLNRVQVMRAREVRPIFYDDVPPTASMPPESFRNDNAFVVSYPVNENSMISSDEILFEQGSTRFANDYSYDVVSTLADAMKEMPSDVRFAIEGHASAEGSYENNMTLSQERAERIVRDMVRRGVSPYRLVPVGYGESEAVHPADAPDHLRSRDRRVVIYRLSDEPVAAR